MAYARSRFRAGDQLPTALFHSWRLAEQVDSGSNGEVWLAQSEVGALEVAVKILTRFGGDGYPRFRREVLTLEEMLFTDLAVLPILDAHVPDQLSRRDPPWYCMPFATPIRHALHEAAPRETARAISRIARTLARLSDEHNISHRDIKPENLFFHEGAPAIGDFGLVLRQEDEPLTEEGRAIGGPRSYVPDEVRFNRPNIDWEKVDVYCLAKTMWALIAEADFPPSGRIAAGGFYSLERTGGVEEAYLGELDAIIDRSTAEDPAERRTIADFADEIGYWLEALDMRQGIVAADVRARANKRTALTWLVAWARHENSNFSRNLIDLQPPDDPSVVPGLSNRELGDALQALHETGMIEGERLMAMGPDAVCWSKVFPTFWAIEEVEDRRALEARVAPVMRYLQGNPFDVLSLNVVDGVALGAQMTGPNAYFRLRYMRDRGWVDFDDLPEGGGGATLINLHLTDSGLARIAR
jgi:serine/threonine protein kinase